MSLVVVARRLDAVNIGWTNMTRGALLYLVICLPNDLTKLNLSGCRTSLLDEGSRHFVCLCFTINAASCATSNTVLDITCSLKDVLSVRLTYFGYFLLK